MKHSKIIFSITSAFLSVIGIAAAKLHSNHNTKQGFYTNLSGVCVQGGLCYTINSAGSANKCKVTLLGNIVRTLRTINCEDHCCGSALFTKPED